MIETSSDGCEERTSSCVWSVRSQKRRILVCPGDRLGAGLTFGFVRANQARFRAADVPNAGRTLAVMLSYRGGVGEVLRKAGALTAAYVRGGARATFNISPI